MSENPIGGPIYVHGATLAYNDICAERIRQDVQWGGPAHDDAHLPSDWFIFIGRQLDILIREDADGEKPISELAVCCARLVKIGALAVAGIQAIDRAAGSSENSNG